MTDFTPLASTCGGMLIGLSAVLLMATNGRIAGISGIVGNLLPPYNKGAGTSLLASSLAFVAGLLAAALIYQLATHSPVPQTVPGNVPLMIGGGLLVGFGTAYGGGCTSGHGVCGLARFSPRSLAAVATFMATAFATVFVIRHLIGG